MQPPKIEVKVGDDFSHEHRIRTLLISMKDTCRDKSIPCPIQPFSNDQINGAITPQLEDMLMIAAFPGCEILIAHGMEPGKMEKHDRRKKGVEITEYHFPTRAEAVGVAMEVLERAMANMRGTGGGHA